jgi:hypothetical protein
MNKLLILAAAAALTGCVATAPLQNSAGVQPSQQELTECEYEATKASAGIRSGIEAGYMQGTIRRQCLAVKGYR